MSAAVKPDVLLSPVVTSVFSLCAWVHLSPKTYSVQSNPSLSVHTQT